MNRCFLCRVKADNLTAQGAAIATMLVMNAAPTMVLERLCEPHAKLMRLGAGAAAAHLDAAFPGVDWRENLS